MFLLDISGQKGCCYTFNKVLKVKRYEIYRRQFGRTQRTRHTTQHAVWTCLTGTCPAGVNVLLHLRMNVTNIITLYKHFIWTIVYHANDKNIDFWMNKTFFSKTVSSDSIYLPLGSQTLFSPVSRFISRSWMNQFSNMIEYLGEFFQDLRGILIELQQHQGTTTIRWNLGYNKIVCKISFFPEKYSNQLPNEQYW